MTPKLVFGHAGDLGDCIASLPTVRAMGGGAYVCFHRDKGCRESLQGARFESLKSLLEIQPYIDGVFWTEAPDLTVRDFSTFRGSYRNGVNLAQQHAWHLGVAISETPWLVATPSLKTKGRTVLSRSRRYHNERFPWDKILQRHKDPLFVGLPDEYLAFQTKWGKPIEHHTASNLLELASLIAGCSLFIGNQSCPFWIACGLGVPLIQESWEIDPNSIIERANAKYCLNGTSPL